MNKELIGFIKYLYNEDNLSIDNIDKVFQRLEKDSHLTKYEQICDFENDLISSLKDFKSEILDYLLILLAQMKEIKEIKEVYERLNTIQSVLKKFLKEVEEAECEAIDAKDIEEEKELLNSIYGYKASPDELPCYKC